MTTKIAKFKNREKSGLRTDGNWNGEDGRRRVGIVQKSCVNVAHQSSCDNLYLNQRVARLGVFVLDVDKYRDILTAPITKAAIPSRPPVRPQQTSWEA